MEQTELQRAIEAILFASGERVEISRLAMALEADDKDVEAAADALADELAFNRRGIRILRLEQIPRPDDAADALALAICHGHCCRGQILPEAPANNTFR